MKNETEETEENKGEELAQDEMIMAFSKTFSQSVEAEYQNTNEK